MQYYAFNVDNLIVHMKTCYTFSILLYSFMLKNIHIF